VTAYSTFGGHGSSYLKLEQIEKIAHRLHKSSSQVLVRWALQRGLVVIPKSVNADRIRQNLDVLDFELTQADLDEIKALDTNTTCLTPEMAFGFYPFS